MEAVNLTDENTLALIMCSEFEPNSRLNTKFVDVADDSYSVDVDTDDTLTVENEGFLEEKAQKQEDVKRVNVMDIFKTMKPFTSKNESNKVLETRKNRDIDEIEAEENIRLVEESEKCVKSGITAKDILTGNPNTKSKRMEPESESESESEPKLIQETKDKVHVSGKEESETEIEGEDIVVIPSEADYKEPQTKAKNGITALDILTGQKKQKKPKEVPPVSEIVELLSSDEKNTNITKPKKKKYTKKRIKPSGSLLVSFNYKPQHKRLAEIEEKIKQSVIKKTSMKDMFKSFNRKKEFSLTLKLNPELLKSIKPTKTLFHEKEIIKPGAKSFLSVLSHDHTKTRSNVYKLKEMPLPKLTRENMYVTFEESKIKHRSIDLPAKNKTFLIDDLDYSEIKGNKTDDQPPYRIVFEEYKGDQDIYELAVKKVGQLEENVHYSRFINWLTKEKPIDDTWTSAFKPEKASDILIDFHLIQSIKQWLSNSFTILKSHTKRVNLRFKKVDDEMEDFIVNEEFDNSREEDAYVPLLIIAGPEGVGKSSAVYSLVQDVSGYVHEISASQYRGRKDIMANLKEMSTTQLVHQNQETVNENVFQKGVILFEDVDILFEQDKGFWSVLESLLMISRRPLIVTCNDLTTIPSNILKAAANEQQVYEFKKQKKNELEDYLYLVGLVNKLVIDYKLLDHIIDENDSDLRRCLNNLEMICKNNISSRITSVKLKTTQNFKPSINSINSLTEYTSKIDLFSISNLIENNTYSLINHVTSQCELVNEENQLNEEELYTTILPFEFNATDQIQDLLPTYPCKSKIHKMYHIKKLDQEYYKSKLKQPKRFTRSAITSSMQLFMFDDAIYNTSVFDIVPSEKYTTDVSPFFREFARYDASVDEYNKKMIEIEANKRTGDLKMEGAFKNRRFEMLPQQLLYDPLKAWRQ